MNRSDLSRRIAPRFRVTVLRLLLAGVVLSSVAFPPGEAEAATYFIAPQGDDAAPGSSDQPWRTFANLGSGVLQPGDSVKLASGIYNEKMVLVGLDGITIEAWTPEQGKPVLDALGLTVGNNLGGVISFRNCTELTLRNLRIEKEAGNPEPPVYDFYGLPDDNGDGRNDRLLAGIAGRDSAGITIEDCETHYTAASGIILKDCSRVHLAANTVRFPGHCTTNRTEEGISLGACDDVLIERNVVADTKKEGIDCKGGGRNLVIANNTVLRTATGIYIDAQKRVMENVIIAGNTIAESGYHGFGGPSEVDPMGERGRGISFQAEKGGAIFNLAIYHNRISKTNGAGIANGNYQKSITTNVWIAQNTLFHCFHQRYFTENEQVPYLDAMRPIRAIEIGCRRSSNYYVFNNIVLWGGWDVYGPEDANAYALEDHFLPSHRSDQNRPKNKRQKVDGVWQVLPMIAPTDFEERDAKAWDAMVVGDFGWLPNRDDYATSHPEVYAHDALWEHLDALAPSLSAGPDNGRPSALDTFYAGSNVIDRYCDRVDQDGRHDPTPTAAEFQVLDHPNNIDWFHLVDPTEGVAGFERPTDDRFEVTEGSLYRDAGHTGAYVDLLGYLEARFGIWTLSVPGGDYDIGAYVLELADYDFSGRTLRPSGLEVDPGAYEFEEVQNVNLIDDPGFGAGLVAYSGRATAAEAGQGWLASSANRWVWDGAVARVESPSGARRAIQQVIHNGGASVGAQTLRFDAWNTQTDGHDNELRIQVFGFNDPFEVLEWDLGSPGVPPLFDSGDIAGESFPQTTFEFPGGVDLGAGYQYLVVRVWANFIDPAAGDHVAVDNFVLTGVAEAGAPAGSFEGQHLYAGYDGGKIFRIAPDGSHSIYATQLGGATRGLAMDEDGTLWVAVGPNLLRIDPTPDGTPATFDNGYVSVFVTGLRSPLGMAIDPNGDFWVAEHYDGVAKIDRETGSITPIYVEGGAYNVECGPNGHLYVSRQSGNTVYEFRPDGTPVHGTPEDPEPIATGYQGHRSIVFDRGGDILLIQKQEISRLASDGTYQGTFFDWEKSSDFTVEEFVARGMKHPMDLAVDSSGVVYGSDARFNAIDGVVDGAIYKYHADGTRERFFSYGNRFNWMAFWPADGTNLAVDPSFSQGFVVDDGKAIPEEAGVGWLASTANRWTSDGEVAYVSSGSGARRGFQQVIHDAGASTGPQSLRFDAWNTEIDAKPNELRIQVFGFDGTFEVNEYELQSPGIEPIFDSATVSGNLGGETFGPTSFEFPDGVDLGAGYEHLVIRVWSDGVDPSVGEELVVDDFVLTGSH